MSNPSNHGIVTGRLADDPKTWTNQNSKTVKLTIMADRDYKGPDGQVGSDAVSLVAFLPNDAQGFGVFDLMRKGDLVTITYALGTNAWTDKDGKQHWDTQVTVDKVKLLESKATTQARLARRLEAAEAANRELKATTAPAPAQAQAQPAVQPVLVGEPPF